MRIYGAAVLSGGHDHILNHPHAVQSKLVVTMSTVQVYSIAITSESLQRFSRAPRSGINGVFQGIFGL
jgi:hypothetical protein